MVMPLLNEHDRFIVSFETASTHLRLDQSVIEMAYRIRALERITDLVHAMTTLAQKQNDLARDMTALETEMTRFKVRKNKMDR